VLRSPKGHKALQPYSYEPIRDDGYLRYLILDPAKGDEPLSGSLIIKHINEALEFDAVSYVWGKPRRVDKIICDGKSISITASLRDALRRIRLPDTPRNLWADQICINQGDLEERGHQVQLMGKIFLRSSTTLLWLGGAAYSDVKDIQSLVADVNNMVEPDLLGVNRDWEKLPALSLTHPIFEDKRWISFSKMTHCEWFKRVWIVQEAGLSRNPLIIYGSHEFEWDSWNLVLAWVSHRGFSIASDYDIIWNPLHVSRAQIWTESNQVSKSENGADINGRGSEEEWSLPEILHSARYLQATDPRDHVYAFLGHPSATHAVSKELLLIPDYTAKALDVYLDFAVRWSEWANDLSILSYVQHESEGEIKKNPASWVPIWNTKLPMNSISTNISGGFNAGMERTAMPRVLKSSLQVRGVIFDTLDYTSEILREEDLEWRDGVPQDSQTVTLWKNILLHIAASSPGGLFGNQTSFLAKALTPLYCGSLSGYQSDANAHIAAFIMSRIAISKVEISPDLLGFLQAASMGGDPHLVESDCRISYGRRLGISQSAYYALIPPNARKGDLCCIFFGGNTPFIIRPGPAGAGLAGHYQFVGEAYVSGIMEGQIVKRFQRGEFQEQDIILV